LGNLVTTECRLPQSHRDTEGFEILHTHANLVFD